MSMTEFTNEGKFTLEKDGEKNELMLELHNGAWFVVKNEANNINMLLLLLLDTIHSKQSKLNN